MNYTIQFPDGRRVSAGTEGAAIRTLTCKAAAFPGKEFVPGGVCATELSLELFDDGLVCVPGDGLLLYRGSTLVGTYLVRSSTTPIPGLRRILAHDRISLLDRDLTDWLEGLTGWPYTLSDLAHMVCRACGLTLMGSLANAQWPVEKFRARSITGRELMQWVCQAGCRFCRAEPDGTLRLCWVRERDLTLGRTGGDFYYLGSLSHADYAVAPVDGVSIARTEGDVGVLTPQTAKNPLRIQGNYLLAGAGEAQGAEILAQMAGLSYTPCSLTTPTSIAPGDLFWVETERGRVRALAMSVETTPFLCRVTCTGSPDRSDPRIVCRGDYQAMGGRVLELELSLKGVSSRLEEYGEDRTRYSQLSQDVDEITARVGELNRDTEQKFSALALRAQGLELTVASLGTALDGKADGEQVTEMAEHFLFGESGLTISNSATGMGINVSEKQVAFTGGNDPTTSITPTEMETTNLRIGCRMDVGDFVLIPRTNGNLSLRYTGG